MRHSFGRRRLGAAARVALLFLSGVLIALGLASPASAGDQAVDPSTSVNTDCVDGVGTITVTLIDGSYPVTYDIIIDSVLVGDGVPEGTYSYKPYAAGDYDVTIKYDTLTRPVVNDDTWTVDDCGPVPPESTVAPTTAAPTTAAPTTAAPTTAAPTTTASGSGAVVPTSAAPVLPATGRPSGDLAAAAVMFSAIGGGLLLIVRRTRRV